MARFVVLSFSALECPVNSQGDLLSNSCLLPSSSSLSPSPLVDRIRTDRGKRVSADSSSQLDDSQPDSSENCF